MLEGPSGQITKGAGNRSFVFNFPTPDIAQGLPGLSAPQKALNGDKVYPCRVGTPGQGHRQAPAALPGQQSLPLDGRQLELKLYPGLSSAALKADDRKELALWYELRAINVTHMGKLPLEGAVAALVSCFGYTQSTAYRLLQAGDGKLWEVKGSSLSSGFRGRSVVKLRSLLEVSEYFNTYSGRPVEVKVSDFKGPRAKKTAWLYASFFKPDGSRTKPISRASISVATGVGRRQQRRYDKLAAIKRVFNGAFQQDSRGKLVPMRHLVFGKSRQWLKDRRLGNSYNSRALKAPRGMTKRVNAELRRRSYNQDKMSCVPIKRFFLSARSYLRNSERDKEPFLLVNKRDRLIPGRMEWCLV